MSGAPLGSRDRAVSLLETLVAASMLGVILVAVIGIYIHVATLWSKADTQSTLLNGLRSVSIRLTRDLEASAYDGLSVSTYGLCCLVPTDARGRYVVDAALGELRWERYVLYYLDASRQSLLRREVPLAATAPQRRSPGPISLYNPGTGFLPLTDWFTGGLSVARDIVDLRFEGARRVIRVTLTNQRQRYGRLDPEQASQSFTVRVRN